jgi:YesN/AraC family two-component response regulator
MDTKKIRKQTDYSQGKIYIIKCVSDEDLIYVGSTCRTLEERMKEHRRDMNYSKYENIKLYAAMRELGSDTFHIELLENLECESRKQLTNREGEKIKEYRPVLNDRIEGRTPKEYQQDNKDYIKHKNAEHYKLNINKIKEHQKHITKIIKIMQ